ncbi:MAG: molybdopterin-dependent oxidoreductase [Thermodesulfobacteriota bacterium]
MTAHSSHWGAFTVEVAHGDVAAVHPLHDPDPSPLLRNLTGSLRHPSRIARPVVRRGWLERGPGPSSERGADAFVELDWDEALDLGAGELRRVVERHGNQAIFGGSYGWASAGLFHQSQRQLHRFLNLLGGFTASHNSYSIGASLVLLPHVVGSAGVVFRKATSWDVIARHTELLVAFGGVPLKTTTRSSPGSPRASASATPSPSGAASASGSRRCGPSCAGPCSRRASTPLPSRSSGPPARSRCRT